MNLTSLKPVPVPHPIPVPELQQPQQTEQQTQDKDKKVVTVLIVTIILALLLLLLLLLLFLNRASQSTGHSNMAGSQTETSGGGLGVEAAGDHGMEINSGGIDADNTDTSIQSQNQTDIADGQKNEAQNDPNTTDAAEQETEQENGHKQQNESAAAQVSDEIMSKETNDKTQGEKLAANLNDRKDDQKSNQKSFDGTEFNSLQKHDATLRVFGTSGKGSSFVFVFDHSGSMAGRPLNRAKAELLQCLESLNQNHLLNIIFFDDQYMSWRKELTSVTKRHKQSAVLFIEAVSPRGGTQPLPALLQAIKSKPNVIFFLTDGEFMMDLDDVCPQAGKTKINVIQFGSSEFHPSPLLQNLAKRTNGDYRYINVELLDKL